MSNITEIPEVASLRTFHQLGILVLDESGYIYCCFNN